MKKLDADRVNPCGYIETVEDINKEWHRGCSYYVEDLCDMAEEFPCEINGELWTSSIGFRIVYAYINLDNDDWSEFHFYNVIDDDNWVGRKDINGNEIEQLTWGELSDDIQNKLMEHYYNVVFPALFDRFYLAYYDAVISGKVDNGNLAEE
jgi:hypothetical protein